MPINTVHNELFNTNPWEHDAGSKGAGRVLGQEGGGCSDGIWWWHSVNHISPVWDQHLGRQQTLEMHTTRQMPTWT